MGLVLTESTNRLGSNRQIASPLSISATFFGNGFFDQTQLAPFMFDTLKNNAPFDLDSYKKLLKKYKNRNPERIPDLLQREPLFPL